MELICREFADVTETPLTLLIQLKHWNADQRLPDQHEHHMRQWCSCCCRPQRPPESSGRKFIVAALKRVSRATVLCWLVVNCSGNQHHGQRLNSHSSTHTLRRKTQGRSAQKHSSLLTLIILEGMDFPELRWPCTRILYINICSFSFFTLERNGYLKNNFVKF